MKKIYLFFCFMGFGQLFAQQTANLVLFTDQGEPFYAYVNSVKQNESAASNVKLTDLNSEFIKLRVEFEDSDLEGFDKNLMLSFGHEITALIKQNNKGKYVIRPFGEPVPIASAPARQDDQPVVIYHDEPIVSEMEHRPEPIHTQEHQPETITTVTHTENQTTTPSGGKANVGVNVDGVAIHMNVDIQEPGDHGVIQHETHTTHTTTTTTTTTTTDRPVRQPEYHDVIVYEEEEEAVREPLIPGYNGPVGCMDYLMSEQPFNAAKKSIESKSFEDDKMTVARQISRNQCLTTQQVKDIMSLFTFEASKLEWAKMAYERTYDIGNYWMLNDAFTFSSSIDELDEYIESRR